MPYYKHIFCECGGIIGMWDKRKGFVCDKCQKEYALHELKFDWLLVNEKTGWQFPVQER